MTENSVHGVNGTLCRLAQKRDRSLCYVLGPVLLLLTITAFNNIYPYYMHLVKVSKSLFMKSTAFV